jgi:hypothetical protein
MVSVIRDEPDVELEGDSNSEEEGDKEQAIKQELLDVPLGELQKLRGRIGIKK